MPQTIMAVYFVDRGTDPHGRPLAEAEAWIAEAAANQLVFRSGEASGKREAQPVDELIRALLGVAPADGLWVAHHASRLVQAWDGSATPLPPILDLDQLAAIFFPFCPAGHLANLRNAAQVEARVTHGEAVALIWRQVAERAAALPSPIVEAMLSILNSLPDHAILREWLTELASQRSPASSGENRLSDAFRSSGYVESRPREPDRPPETIDAEAVSDILGPHGPLTTQLPNYEYRAGQAAMARAVAEAFNSGRHLLAEAGTGIGKSLAYLVPAAAWALQNQSPVVVSTNTKNLQSQLFEKDLPLIRNELFPDLQSALIKGRQNYLCLRKLNFVTAQAALECRTPDRLKLLHVLGWAIRTDDGDFSESPVLEQSDGRMLRSQLSSTADECPGRNCPHARRCFLRRARAAARSADIVVANHALVFAELGIRSPALPEYDVIVLDEAHNLEEAATRHFSIEISALRLRLILNHFWRPGRRRQEKGSGLLPLILDELERDQALEADQRHAAAAAGRQLKLDLVQCRDDLEAFLSCVEHIRRDTAHRGDTLRLTPAFIEQDLWRDALAAQRELCRLLEQVNEHVEELESALERMDADLLPFHQDFVQDLAALRAQVTDFSDDVSFVIAADDPNYVYWIERNARADGLPLICAAPIEIGERLAADLYQQKRSVILTSATLTVRQSFDFSRKRLGLSHIDSERTLEFSAESPFDYQHQCAVLAPDFLPDPSDRGEGKEYAARLGKLLARIFNITRGRGMALFTSYEMLRRVSEVMQEHLDDRSIQVLMQGASGSRENITTLFRQDVESVLMGTHSFWEGVDLVGETLSCLVVARLPFAVYTDPIQEARAEHIKAEGGEPFTEYSLPAAVIRFRQGFGRLIRHRHDRGIVIITDRRLVKRSYGKWFRESLPARTIRIENPDKLFEALNSFLYESG